MGLEETPTPSTTPQKKSERTRRRILDAAEHVFGERGYHDASIVEITQTAGLAQGTFYLYFENKLEIFRELVRARMSELYGAVGAAVAAVSDHTDRRAVQDATFRSMFRWIAAHPKIYRVARQAEFVDASLLQDIYAVQANAYAASLAGHMDSGDLPRSDPEVLAWSIIGMGDLSAWRWLTVEGEAAPGEERVAAFVELTCRAIGLPPASVAP